MAMQINVKADKLKLPDTSTDLHDMKGPKALIAGVLSQHLILALAAASPAPSIILSSDNVTQDITLPFPSCKTISENSKITGSSNVTRTTSNLTKVPPDVFNYYVPGTDLTLRLFDFDILQPFARILDVEIFAQANRDAIDIYRRADVPIIRYLEYTAKSEVPGSMQEVTLEFFPGPKMTWKLWAEVIFGLAWFTGCYEDVGLRFIVVQRYEGTVAGGHIMNDLGRSTEST